jgi:hypothetical protein
MSFFDKLRQTTALSRLHEESLYEKVSQELKQGMRREGLWAKALADSDGVEERVKALYIKYRVQSIKDETEISGVVAEHAVQESRRESAARAERERVKAGIDEEQAVFAGIIKKWLHVVQDGQQTREKVKPILRGMRKDVEEVLRRMTFLEQSEPERYKGDIEQACKKLGATAQFSTDPLEILQALDALAKTLIRRPPS